MLNHISWEGGIASDYYFWLCDKVGYQEDYDPLLRFIFDVEFTWTIGLDESRSLDGLRLREQFMEEEDVRGDWDDDNPCSVLEMLVALSIKVEEDILGDPDICLFWRMLDHLGLTETGNQNVWTTIIDDWLSRNIARDGRGGIFPLNDPPRNQRYCDIWEQCMSWINSICWRE